MLVPALIIATIVSLVTVFAALRLSMRVSSMIARACIWIPSVLIILLSWALASLTLQSVQAAIIMAAMQRQEPIASIMKESPVRFAIQVAVHKGLAREGGSMRSNVEAEVSKVVKPYMAWRISHAPDADIVSLANIMNEAMNAADDKDCAAIMGAGISSLSGEDRARLDRWTVAMLSREPLDQPKVASPQEISNFMLSAVSSPAGVRLDNPASRCTTTKAAISAALSLPAERSAPLLRGIGLARVQK